MRFHQLRCDKCGNPTNIGFDNIVELHLRLLKTLGFPSCFPEAVEQDAIRKGFKCEPISEDEYDREVERIAGKCKCGGQHLFKAPIRCPKCRSTNIRSGRVVMYYD